MLMHLHRLGMIVATHKAIHRALVVGCRHPNMDANPRMTRHTRSIEDNTLAALLLLIHKAPHHTTLTANLSQIATDLWINIIIQRIALVQVDQSLKVHSEDHPQTMSMMLG